MHSRRLEVRVYSLGGSEFPKIKQFEIIKAIVNSYVKKKNSYVKNQFQANCFIFGNSLPPRLYTLTSSLRECNLRLFKWGYLHHCGPGKGLKGIFGNRTCLFINWWSLEIMLTDPNMYSNLMHLLDNRKIRKRRLSRIKFIDFFIDWIYR